MLTITPAREGLNADGKCQTGVEWDTSSPGSRVYELKEREGGGERVTRKHK